ncbi:hypothetical protein [[Flexibacter] sp. ATCC 35208]|uniref:hypothetical protein n=1 Tax=[Flexibacter] sp. ATCC 35208 TaxID=1936242 RepID=UPI0009D0D8ED|nr:hypothetical protein [[Flexibacter] sp. ATCC 35208]OMP75444.1 hypothetical protein BW716_30040 [[Flexibacter] sp. ATCC 35208]
MENKGMIEMVGNAKIWGVKGMKEGAFVRHIFSIELPLDARGKLGGLRQVMEFLEQEARAAHASRLEIYGYSVYAPAFRYSEQMASKWAKFGVIQEAITEGIKMTKILIF